MGYRVRMPGFRWKFGLIEGDRTGPPGRGEYIYDYQRTGEIPDLASGSGSGDPVNPKVAPTGE